MHTDQSIEKPQNRGWLRKKLGREYFIFKRIILWITTGKQWSKIDNSINFKYKVKHHKSMIFFSVEKPPVAFDAHKLK